MFREGFACDTVDGSGDAGGAAVGDDGDDEEVVFAEADGVLARFAVMGFDDEAASFDGVVGPAAVDPDLMALT